MDMMKLYQKYKSVILYVIFGALTTLVNISVYWLLAHPIGLPVMPGTVIAWIASVLFAYLTNRKWVFCSEARGKREILMELASFFSCRLATGVVDWLCMWLFVDVLHYNDVLIKVIANVVVIVLNYIASKLVIFRHKKN